MKIEPAMSQNFFETYKMILKSWNFVILKAIIFITSELIESLLIFFPPTEICSSLLAKGTMTKESGTLHE